MIIHKSETAAKLFEIYFTYLLQFFDDVTKIILFFQKSLINLSYVLNVVITFNLAKLVTDNRKQIVILASTQFYVFIII